MFGDVLPAIRNIRGQDSTGGAGRVETTGMVRVRRERRLVHSGCKSHPGTGSFHPVAIGAAVEATKLLKPPMYKGRQSDYHRKTQPDDLQMTTI